MLKIIKWRLKGHVWNESESWFLKKKKTKQDQQTSCQTNQKKEEIMQVNKSRVVKERIL